MFILLYHQMIKFVENILFLTFDRHDNTF